MSLHLESERITLHHGDCIEVMRALPDNSIDSIVTDPPYGLGFMGKEWDALPPGKEWAEECLRVLKPGGHLLAFGGTRTWHRLAVAVEDAGFEIRDSLAWLYGSGFPKSQNVGKKAEEWQGWGTALKPAFEPVVMGRKPFKGTVAANVLEHGTAALNIDASRIGTSGGRTVHTRSDGTSRDRWEGNEATGEVTLHGGRFPANVLLDDYTAEVLDEQSGTLTSGKLMPHHADNGKATGAYGAFPGAPGREAYGDSGGASRFFYVAKAPKSERPVVNGVAHETVKPLAIMRYLVKMVTPPGGIVLEPFAGSGTTVEACILEGFSCIAIEREQAYLPLIEARIERQRNAPEEEPTLDIFGEAA